MGQFVGVPGASQADFDELNSNITNLISVSLLPNITTSSGGNYRTNYKYSEYIPMSVWAGESDIIISTWDWIEGSNRYIALHVTDLSGNPKSTYTLDAYIALKAR